MGKRKSLKQSKSSQHVVVGKKQRTAFSMYQDVQSTPSPALSAGKKKKQDRTLAKKTKQAMKRSIADTSDPKIDQDKKASSHAQTFFRMLKSSANVEQVKSIPIVTADVLASDPGKGKSGESSDGGGKKGRRRSRGKKKVSEVLDVSPATRTRSSPRTSTLETVTKRSKVGDTDASKKTVTGFNDSKVASEFSKKSTAEEVTEIVAGGSISKRKRKSVSNSPSASKKSGSKSSHTREAGLKGVQNKGLEIVGHGNAEDVVSPGTDGDVTAESMVDTTLEEGEEADGVTGESMVDTTQEMEEEEIWDEDGVDVGYESMVTTVPSTEESLVYLHLAHQQCEICLRGKYALKSIFGSVSILGYKVGPDTPQLEVFSPENSSHLMINGNADEAPMTLEEKNNILQKAVRCETARAEIGELLTESSILISVSKLGSDICEKVGAVPPFESLFPKYPVNGCSYLERIGLTLPWEETKMCTISEEYQEVAEEFTGAIRSDSQSPQVLVVCGGKNVGKSTLARYLINSALNSCERVGYLECDVGQTEFTPPGCVALNIISKPLLGPPFSHQMKPECMIYIGAASPADNPTFYVECIRKAFNVYETIIPRIPLVVNTMGWTQGMGIPLLMDTLQIVSPTFLVQLQSSNYYRNYQPLTEEYVSQTPGWRHPSSNVSKDVAFKHFMVTSPTNLGKDGREKYKAADHRDLAILAYFSPVVPPSVSLLNIHSVKPYKLPWNSVAVHVSNVVVPRSQIMYALNATIVALCHAESSLMHTPSEDTLPKFFSKMPSCDCLGFGLIRAVDPVQKVFYVLTPMTSKELHHVNAVVKGAVSVPNQLLLKKSDANAVVPYIDNPQNVHGVQPVSRHYLKRTKPPRKREDR